MNLWFFRSSLVIRSSQACLFLFRLQQRTRRELERADSVGPRHPEYRYSTEFQSHEPEVMLVSLWFKLAEAFFEHFLVKTVLICRTEAGPIPCLSLKVFLNFEILLELVYIIHWSRSNTFAVSHLFYWRSRLPKLEFAVWLLEEFGNRREDQ